MSYRIILLLLIMHAFSSFAQEKEQLLNKVDTLLELTGSKAQFNTMIDSILNIEKKNLVTPSAKNFIENFRAEIKNKGYEEVRALLVPAYAKELTLQEIDALISFYKTPLGQSIQKKMPNVLLAAYHISQKWSKQLVQKIKIDLYEKQLIQFNLEIETDCSSFRRGIFYEQLDETLTANITRAKYTEKVIAFEGIVWIYRIEWIDNNSYILYRTEGNQEHWYRKVNIYQVDGTSYQYIAKKPDGSFSFGRIYSEE